MRQAPLTGARSRTHLLAHHCNGRPLWVRATISMANSVTNQRHATERCRHFRTCRLRLARLLFVILSNSCLATVDVGLHARIAETILYALLFRGMWLRSAPRGDRCPVAIGRRCRIRFPRAIRTCYPNAVHSAQQQAGELARLNCRRGAIRASKAGSSAASSERTTAAWRSTPIQIAACLQPMSHPMRCFSQSLYLRTPT
jgi:hypothetical protein